MGLATFGDLGAIGVIDEIPDHATPMNAWTTANNVTFRDSHVQSSRGYTEVTSPLLTRPQFLLPYYDPDSAKLFWLYPGVNDLGKGLIASYDGSSHVDLTDTANYPSPGFYGDTVRWNGAIVNGLVVLNNRVGIPQMWDRATGGTLDADFSDLTGWPSGDTCAVMRGFRNFFIALDITNTGKDPDRNPYEIKHSGIVDPYTAPEWAPLTTNRAGSKYIGEGGGVIIDCLPMRGVNIVYTENEAWPMTYVGGNEVFAIGDKALLEYGMLTQGCAAAFGAGSHFVVTTGDIIVHDGANAQSIIDGRVRDTLFADIDSDNFVNCFVVSHYSEGEVWFCYPGSGSIYPNKVAKWNVKSGAWSLMDLPIETAAIKFGAVPITGTDGTWDTDSQAWDLDDSVWNVGNYNPTIKNLMLAQTGATIATSALQKADDGLDFNGTPFNVTLEKTGIIVAGSGPNGPYMDPNVDKFVDEIWPRIEGGPVSVAVGTAQTIDGTYTWTNPQSFDPTTDKKLDFRPIEGYYWAIRFTSSGVAWHLDGYDANVQATGSRG
jgi:hypothetical protein